MLSLATIPGKRFVIPLISTTVFTDSNHVHPVFMGLVGKEQGQLLEPALLAYSLVIITQQGL